MTWWPVHVAGRQERAATNVSVPLPLALQENRNDPKAALLLPFGKASRLWTNEGASMPSSPPGTEEPCDGKWRPDSYRESTFVVMEVRGGASRVFSSVSHCRGILGWSTGVSRHTAVQIRLRGRRRDDQSMPWLYIGPEVSILGLISLGLVWVASRA